jgi:hypothetical protein
MPPELLVTTSWDDGAPQDLKLADLLEKYQLPGCFYVPRSNPERPVLEPRAVAQLARRFEIGGHTLSHLPLPSLDPGRARAEIRDCKTWLADVTGDEIVSFCYPGGKFTPAHVREVAAAGYGGARTADWLCLDRPTDRFRIAPSVQIYPHARLVHVLHCLRRGHLKALRDYSLRLAAPVQPLDLTRGLLTVALERGGVLHIWGHSWEIDAQGLWPQLEAIFALLAEVRARATFVDNGQLAARLEGAGPRA